MNIVSLFDSQSIVVELFLVRMFFHKLINENEKENYDGYRYYWGIDENLLE
jgi:hypothetical protein